MDYQKHNYNTIQIIINQNKNQITMPKKTLTLHIEGEVLDNFKNYCKLNALKVSAKIELLLKQ